MNKSKKKTYIGKGKKGKKIPDSFKIDCSKINCKPLEVEGTKYRTLLTKKFENRKKWINPDYRLISSFIPGTILRINIKNGQAVKKGDQILILEAMKMENKILFSENGIVKAIHVKEGEKIPKGKLMVELE